MSDAFIGASLDEIQRLAPLGRLGSLDFIGTDSMSLRCLASKEPDFFFLNPSFALVLTSREVATQSHPFLISLLRS
jgi:hypothetical protein